MAISVRLNDEDATLIRKYAALKKMSVSELIRQTLLERIEDEYDLKAYEEAMKTHKENPITYSHEAVKQMFELE